MSVYLMLDSRTSGSTTTPPQEPTGKLSKTFNMAAKKPDIDCFKIVTKLYNPIYFEVPKMLYHRFFHIFKFTGYLINKPTKVS